MVFKHLTGSRKVEDKDFDLIYPKSFREISEFHFTPVHVAIQAARFLGQSKTSRILDIGSGLGKFCMIGSVKAKGNFVGVEYRNSLSIMAGKIAKRYQLPNVEFIHSNINRIDFKEFDAFYFFNSFYENMQSASKINDEVKLSQESYHLYSTYVKDQLDTMPKGTRVVTYFSYTKEIPDSYKVIKVDFEGKLKMWKKVS